MANPVEFITRNGKNALIPVGITALIALLWPKNKTEVTNEDGTTDIVKKSSGFRKAVITVGTIVSATALGTQVSPTFKTWLQKVATKAPAAAGHTV